MLVYYLSVSQVYNTDEPKHFVWILVIAVIRHLGLLQTDTQSQHELTNKTVFVLILRLYENGDNHKRLFCSIVKTH